MFEKDTFETESGFLTITFIGHGTLMFEWAGKIIHIDPVSAEADYQSLPKADLILVTHEHFDHLDEKAIKKIQKDGTEIVYTESCRQRMAGGKVMKNGDKHTAGDIMIEAIPAYNIKHMRSEGKPFHPKGIGNGYILSMGGKRILVAGDTENIPEYKGVTNIDIAFLPMNLPYTMTPEMVADAARIIKPKILYPYHFGNTDTARLVELLKTEKEIEVRIRSMK